MKPLLSQCERCKNRLLEKGVARCQAFTDVIPYEIYFGYHDHREPFKGDNGIRFEPIDEEKS